MKRVIGILLAAVCAQSFAAPNYIELKPLTDVVDTRVGAVKSGVKTLPIITWGGDLATIYGNGGASTQSNSVFKQNGLSFQLDREDIFANQLEDYLSGKTPYLRGTMGMMSLAQDLLNEDPRTRPVVFYQMTWSSGGDALVVKDSIKSAKGLKGKTIAIQAYGPHTDYLFTVLKDAGLKPSDVTLKWLPDLTGTDNSPMAAFYESDIDAAFVITPDAMALTSGGKMGTGAEDSVKGARILMSTKTANRVIADVYAVRSDYYKANKREVETLRSALIASEEGLSNLI
jgi:ABC-type nitrate/sulfonate/bicarbonate transport system substrate-binding protein